MLRHVLLHCLVFIKVIALKLLDYCNGWVELSPLTPRLPKMGGNSLDWLTRLPHINLPMLTLQHIDVHHGWYASVFCVVLLLYFIQKVNTTFLLSWWLCGSGAILVDEHLDIAVWTVWFVVVMTVTSTAMAMSVPIRCRWGEGAVLAERTIRSTSGTSIASTGTVGIAIARTTWVGKDIGSKSGHPIPILLHRRQSRQHRCLHCPGGSSHTAQTLTTVHVEIGIIPWQRLYRINDTWTTAATTMRHDFLIYYT